MSDSEEARILLENKVFQYAVDDTQAEYLQRIKMNPTEDIEAAIAIKVLDDIVSKLESKVFDVKMASNTKEQAKRYS